MFKTTSQIPPEGNNFFFCLPILTFSCSTLRVGPRRGKVALKKTYIQWFNLDVYEL